MTEYVKLISETEIEFAPINKDNVINYNSESNQEMLFADGYKILVRTDIPETDRYFRIIYVNGVSTEILEEIDWLETEPEYEARKLQEAKDNKKLENLTKRQAIDRIKANFSETVSGYLLRQTPVGDIMTVIMGLALPAMMAHYAIPEGAMRYYDENGDPHQTPEITANYVPIFYQNFANNIAKIDQYSTIIEIQINNAQTIEEVNAIVIDYDFDKVEMFLDSIQEEE